MSTASPSAPGPAATSVAFAPPLWSVGVAAVGLVGALFATSFITLVGLWDRDQNYSHGYIVVPISLLLSYRIARRVGSPRSGETFFGLIMVFFGVLCQSAVPIVGWPPLSYLGLIAVLRGLLVCAGGRTWASKFTFPLLFLFFMFPLPVKFTGYAALWLQDLVSRVSETVLGLFFVCQRVGHTIRIAGVDRSLVVAEECSGLGQIVAFLAFAALLGHLLARPAWYRITLLLAAVPVAVAANTLRVVMMNLGAVWFGTKWMTGILHDAPAMFSIPVGVAMFLLFDTILSNLIERRKPSAEDPSPNPLPQGERGLSADPSPTPPPTGEGPHGAGGVGSSPARGLMAACVVLLVGVAVQFALIAHLRSAGEASFPMLNGKLESLPLVIDNPATGQPLWVGQDMAEAREATRKKLPFYADDLLVRGYQTANGAGALLYMVHSRLGEDRKHHPEICIRDVSGAPEDTDFRRAVPLAGEGAAQRFKFQPGGNRVTVVYYWHYDVAPTPNPSQTALQTLHQKIGVVAPSVTVQVTVGTDDPRTLEAIEKVLIPSLDRDARERILPPGTRAGSDRAPIALVRQ